MVLGVNGLLLGLGGGSHMVALFTNPWSHLLLVTGMEVKAWPGVETLCLGDPSAHSGDLDIWCLIAVQTALSELTWFLPREKQHQGASLEKHRPLHWPGLQHGASTSLLCVPFPSGGRWGEVLMSGSH